MKVTFDIYPAFPDTKDVEFVEIPEIALKSQSYGAGYEILDCYLCLYGKAGDDGWTQRYVINRALYNDRLGRARNSYNAHHKSRKARKARKARAEALESQGIPVLVVMDRIKNAQYDDLLTAIEDLV